MSVSRGSTPRRRSPSPHRDAVEAEFQKSTVAGWAGQAPPPPPPSDATLRLHQQEASDLLEQLRAAIAGTSLSHQRLREDAVASVSPSSLPFPTQSPPQAGEGPSARLMPAARPPVGNVIRQSAPARASLSSAAPAARLSAPTAVFHHSPQRVSGGPVRKPVAATRDSAFARMSAEPLIAPPSAAGPLTPPQRASVTSCTVDGSTPQRRTPKPCHTPSVAAPTSSSPSSIRPSSAPSSRAASPQGPFSFSEPTLLPDGRSVSPFVPLLAPRQTALPGTAAAAATSGLLSRRLRSGPVNGRMGVSRASPGHHTQDGSVFAHVGEAPLPPPSLTTPGNSHSHTHGVDVSSRLQESQTRVHTQPRSQTPLRFQPPTLPQPRTLPSPHAHWRTSDPQHSHTAPQPYSQAHPEPEYPSTRYPDHASQWDMQPQPHSRAHQHTSQAQHTRSQSTPPRRRWDADDDPEYFPEHAGPVLFSSSSYAVIHGQARSATPPRKQTHTLTSATVAVAHIEPNPQPPKETGVREEDSVYRAVEAKLDHFRTPSRPHSDASILPTGGRMGEWASYSLDTSLLSDVQSVVAKSARLRERLDSSLDYVRASRSAPSDETPHREATGILAIARQPPQQGTPGKSLEELAGGGLSQAWEAKFVGVERRTVAQGEAVRQVFQPFADAHGLTTLAASTPPKPSRQPSYDIHGDRLYVRGVKVLDAEPGRRAEGISAPTLLTFSYPDFH